MILGESTREPCSDISARADRRVSNMLLLADVMGVTIETMGLPPGLCGLYDDATRTILLHDRLNQRQTVCTLRHELFHAQHHDTGCGPYRGREERRTRRETALALISPAEYAAVERMFDADPWNMAVELGVTMQVLEDYRMILTDGGICRGMEED